jgi:EXS family
MATPLTDLSGLLPSCPARPALLSQCHCLGEGADQLYFHIWFVLLALSDLHSQFAEWDVRTVVDRRKYAEVWRFRYHIDGFITIHQLPAFLLMTLAFAFWLSFSGLDLKIAPTTWPFAWLVLAVLIVVNPLPVFQSQPRRWFLRKSGGVLLSGTRPVTVSLSTRSQFG